MSDESPLTFPCDFPIKIIGNATPHFETTVREIIGKHVPDLDENAIRLRPSGKGNYAAITVTINAGSKQQLDDLYLELNASEAVLMTL